MCHGPSPVPFSFPSVPVSSRDRVEASNQKRQGGREEEEEEFFNHYKNDLERHAHTPWGRENACVCIF